MERPKLPSLVKLMTEAEDKPPGIICSYLRDINEYCTFLEYENAILSAYLQDSLDRVNPILDKDFIATVKEILNVR